MSGSRNGTPIATTPAPARPRVSRAQIIARGLTFRCPNCGERGVFRGLFGVRDRCPRCDFLIQREEGFFLGAMALNFAAAAFPLVPIFVLVFMGRIDTVTAMVICALWATLVPVLFYNMSKSLWMMLVYLAVPTRLPANARATEPYQERF